MNLTKLTADLAVIAKLPDSPTETAAELKAKFDQGPRAIGVYLNDTLLPEVEEALALIDGKVPAVVDSLTSSDNTAALSAAQGQTLANQVQSLDQAKQNRIRTGTSAPSGGSDGDLYIWY